MNETVLKDRIVADPAIVVGKPLIAGTRLTVEHILGLLADGWSTGDLIAEYPGLTAPDISACLAYARDLISSEKIYPGAA